MQAWRKKKPYTNQKPPLQKTTEDQTPSTMMVDDNNNNKEMSVYEKTREERIKENRERMQKLGLNGLALKLNSSSPTHQQRKRNFSESPKLGSPVPTRGPLRRSSRLQNTTPVSYSEGVLENESMILEEGSKPEVYTEEHEKLLGYTERSWTFFVDGYGKDGKRIYDPINGKTCHQCRQKTLGYRTHCSKCQIVQGQFCGDCLYMRYGEHVLEAIENPNWVCPPCRGICNCSLCRQAKGLAPTGPFYRKISSMGYKSVAHYLIQTQRGENNKEKSVNQSSAKRTLPFSDKEAPDLEHPCADEKQVAPLESQSENACEDLKFKTDVEMPRCGNLAAAGKEKSSLSPFPESRQENNIVPVEMKLVSTVKGENVFERNQEESLATQKKHGGKDVALENCVKRKREAKVINEKEREGFQYIHKDMNQNGMPIEDYKNANASIVIWQCLDFVGGNSEVTRAVSSTRKTKKKPHPAEPSTDSIGGRLRLQRRMNRNNDCDLRESDERSSNSELAIIDVSLGEEVISEKARKALQFMSKEENQNGISEDYKDAKSSIVFWESLDAGNSDLTRALTSTGKIKGKPTAVEPSLDSVGGRLRLRRRMNKSNDGDVHESHGQSSNNKLALINVSSEICEKELNEDNIARRLRPRRAS